MAPVSTLIQAPHIRPGDVIVNFEGERIYAAFDVHIDIPKQQVHVFTAASDWHTSTKRGVDNIIHLELDDVVLVNRTTRR